MASLGKGSILLSKAIRQMSISVSISIDLFLKTKRQGRVMLTGTLSEYVPAMIAVGPLSLTLSDLSAANLVNMGKFLDRQDPSLKIQIGSQILKTDR